MSLAFHRLRRRVREASDDGRNPAGTVQLLREFTESHPHDEDGWELVTRTLHDLGRDGEADQAGWRANLALSVLWEGLDDDRSSRSFDRAARYRHAYPLELEDALARDIELFGSPRDAVGDEDLEGRSPPPDLGPSRRTVVRSAP